MGSYAKCINVSSKERSVRHQVRSCLQRTGGVHKDICRCTGPGSSLAGDSDCKW